MTALEATQKHPSLNGVQYPAHKHDLLLQAQSFGVGTTILSFISALPDQEYQTPAELQQAISETLPNACS